MFWRLIMLMCLLPVSACRTVQGPSESGGGIGIPVVSGQRPKKEAPVAYPNAEKSAGCVKVLSGGGVEDLSLQVGALSRRYVRVAPKQLVAGKPLALVIWWHGAASSPELTRGVPDYNHTPELERLTGDEVVWLHPRHIEGTALTWDRSTNGRDFQFFDKLYAQVTADFCIDLKRVYTIGVSNGGSFANHVASVRPKEIKGLVAVALPAIGGSWRKVSMPSMLVQDDRDNFTSAQQTIRKMADDAGCSLQSVDLSARKPASCFLLIGCKADTPVAFCPWQVKPNWNPHDWPRFDGADSQIWRFLTSAKVN